MIKKLFDKARSYLRTEWDASIRRTQLQVRRIDDLIANGMKPEDALKQTNEDVAKGVEYWPRIVPKATEQVSADEKPNGVSKRRRSRQLIDVRD